MADSWTSFVEPRWFEPESSRRYAATMTITGRRARGWQASSDRDLNLQQSDPSDPPQLTRNPTIGRVFYTARVTTRLSKPPHDRPVVRPEAGTLNRPVRSQFTPPKRGSFKPAPLEASS